MRRLERDSVAPPPCLGRYQHGRDDWSALSRNAADLAQVHASLQGLQGTLCAYCESYIGGANPHVEHFRRRHLFPTLTFEWSNLFWSCTQLDCCGVFKDSPKGAGGTYAPDDLLDPCEPGYDPDLYFRFISDGSIAIRPQPGASAARRAAETLRVFNLDGPGARLRSMRRAVLAGYLSMVEPDLDQLAPEDIAEYFREEIRESQGKPYVTAIRHVLTMP